MNATTAEFCFLDIDINNFRQKLATAAAFVDATDSRYGLSSKNLLALGGSEISRLEEMISGDHEWSSKNDEVGGIETRPPASGQRIVIKLYWTVAPLACENFATLCNNGSDKKKIPIGDCGKPLTYRGSPIHRVESNFICQGGDFVKGNGSGGECVFGKRSFKDERPGLLTKHDRRGILAMGNSGKNSNTSQFYFTFGAAPQCDGKHVVFGELVSGMEVLDAIEQHGTVNGVPNVRIHITDCGIFRPLVDPGAGYWYDQPDSEKYSGVSPQFIVRPRVVCLAPNKGALEKFESALGTSCQVVESLEMNNDDTVEQVARIQNLINCFSVDVVLIAPACKGIENSIQLPSRWQDQGIDVAQVALVAKPIDALDTIHQQSWISKQSQWQLDGTL